MAADKRLRCPNCEKRMDHHCGAREFPGANCNVYTCRRCVLAVRILARMVDGSYTFKRAQVPWPVGEEG